MSGKHWWEKGNLSKPSTIVTIVFVLGRYCDFFKALLYPLSCFFRSENTHRIVIMTTSTIPAKSPHPNSKRLFSSFVVTKMILNSYKTKLGWNQYLVCSSYIFDNLTSITIFLYQCILWIKLPVDIHFICSALYTE